jgi:adenylate cyclase
MTATRKIAAILAADVVGYSRLAGMDEDRILARLRALRSDLIDPTIAVHNGRVVKRTGDGSLIEFRSVVDAVRCAVEVQNAMIERNAGVPQDRRIEFRIGIHLGDVVEESDGDLMGDGVNIASRLEGIAAPGAICLSEDAYRQVKARLDLHLTDLGATWLKNIADPIRVYSLQVGVADQTAATLPEATYGATVSSGPSAVTDKPSIAVLAFNNMSGDAEQEYFSDGISEDIITDLSRLPRLHVIARNSSFVYKNAAVSVPEMAKALGVRYVLEGSVRRVGNRVRVTAQLIDASNGGHVWANRFDRDLTDIFAVQDELTQEIVAALKLTLTSSDQDQLAQARAVNVEAYEYLLRGREQASAHTRIGNAEGRRLATAAIAIDPGYAAAHALVALPTCSITSMPGATIRSIRCRSDESWRNRPPTWRKTCRTAISRLAWPACGARSWSARRRRWSAGLALSPNSVDLLTAKAHIQIFAGDPGAAVETLAHSMRLDPHYPEILLQFLADARFSLGQYAAAIDAIEQRLARNPQSETAYALLASCYGHLGRLAESEQAWEHALAINPDFSVARRRRVLPFRNPEDFRAPRRRAPQGRTGVLTPPIRRRLL